MEKASVKGTLGNGWLAVRRCLFTLLGHLDYIRTVQVRAGKGQRGGGGGGDAAVAAMGGTVTTGSSNSS